jgi:hypothetical protein
VGLEKSCNDKIEVHRSVLLCENWKFGTHVAMFFVPWIYRTESPRKWCILVRLLCLHGNNYPNGHLG